LYPRMRPRTYRLREGRGRERERERERSVQCSPSPDNRTSGGSKGSPLRRARRNSTSSRRNKRKPPRRVYPASRRLSSGPACGDAQRWRGTWDIRQRSARMLERHFPRRLPRRGRGPAALRSSCYARTERNRRNLFSRRWVVHAFQALDDSELVRVPLRHESSGRHAPARLSLDHVYRLRGCAEASGKERDSSVPREEYLSSKRR